MEYNCSVPFRGQWRDVLPLAIGALTTLGFRVTSRDDRSADFAGPGLHSTRQNALLGATHIRLEADSGELSVLADLGGIRWLRRFVLLFPPALCAAIGMMLIGIFGFVLPRGLGRAVAIVIAVMLINSAVWILVGPVIVRSFQAKCQRALDALATNLAAAAEHP